MGLLGHVHEDNLTDTEHTGFVLFFIFAVVVTLLFIFCVCSRLYAWRKRTTRMATIMKYSDSWDAVLSFTESWKSIFGTVSVGQKGDSLQRMAVSEADVPMRTALQYLTEDIESKSLP